jgi:hypothetical protein
MASRNTVLILEHEISPEKLTSETDVVHAKYLSPLSS